MRYNVPFGHARWGKAIPCDCTATERAERANAALWERAGVPGRYGTYTFKRYREMAGDDPGKSAAIQAVATYFKLGYIPNPTQPDRPYRGIMLHGEPGVGKTGLLAPLFTSFLQAGAGSLWLQYNEFLNQMRAFDADGGARLIEERKRQVQTIPYVLIDDLGDPDSQRGATEYANDVLLEVINYRVDRDLPMFLTTNLSPTAVGAQFRSRLYRRIAETCAVIEVAGGQILAGAQR